MSSSELLQFLISGLQNGAVYALVGLGFTLVYASTGVINFAQGEFFMLGGMLAVAGVRAGLPLPLAIVAAVLISAGVGVALERFALRPRRDSGTLVLIIITIGASMVLKSLARHIFGPNELALPAFSPGPPVLLFGAAIDRQVLWIWGLTFVAVVGLTLLYTRTKLGRAMRASSLSHDAARLMGIDTAGVVMISFGLAAALGALGGAAVAPLTQTAFDVGARAGLKGFAAAILGGLGNPIAAVVGGLALGVLESMSVAFISSTYKDVISLVLLLAVLFLRPQGLLGKSGREKV